MTLGRVEFKSCCKWYFHWGSYDCLLRFSFIQVGVKWFKPRRLDVLILESAHLLFFLTSEQIIQWQQMGHNITTTASPLVGAFRVKGTFSPRSWKFLRGLMLSLICVYLKISQKLHKSAFSSFFSDKASSDDAYTIQQTILESFLNCKLHKLAQCTFKVSLHYAGHLRLKAFVIVKLFTWMSSPEQGL